MKKFTASFNPTPRRFVIFLLWLFITLGCWAVAGDRGRLAPVVALEPPASLLAQPTKPPKVVFFGSSTTVGVGATRGDRRWSTLLSRYLDWQEFNESLSGSSLSKAPRTDKSWPIPSAVERWQDAILRRNPDRIVMLYGANDAFWKLPLGNGNRPKPATFRGDLNTLLSEMTAVFRPEQLIVVTPQPNQATLERRSPYDVALREGAQRIGAPFIDAAKETFPIEDLKDFSADGLHLNNLGHAAFASALAGRLVDLGITPAPPTAQGGQKPLSKAQTGLLGGFLRVDLTHPLSFGEIHAIAAHWVAPGNARFVILRPDGRGGHEAIYRTPMFAVTPGTTQTAIPRWWVLDGDRLAVWADTDCVGAITSPSGVPQHFAIKREANTAFSDIKPTEEHAEPQTLAIWTVPQ